MALNKYRKNVDGVLTPIAKAFISFDPNTLTWIGLGLAIIAAGMLYMGELWLLPLATLVIILSSLFDAIDGKVARLTGRVSVWGDFLDHAFDRYADVFILGGIMFSPYCNWMFGFFAIVGILLTSYMGTQAQAIGIGRLYSGVMGRAERMVILMFIPLIQFGALFYDKAGNIGPYTPFEYTMILFAVMGNITAVQRIYLVHKQLKKEGKK